jgi:HSP20 family protein
MNWLLRNRPLDRRVENILDRFLEDFPFASISEGGWAAASFNPKVNVAESDKELTVTAELPGMDEKDIEISISDGSLVLKGEKKEEQEEKHKNYYRLERSSGYFHREIAFPCDVDADKAQAVFKKGVLTVTLPKAPKATGRRLEVKSA